MIGVYDAELVLPVAQSLQKNGAEHAMVVHGLDGLDELTTTTNTKVAHLKNSEIKQYEISPSDIGVESASLAQIIGGDPAYNADAIKRLFNGELNGLEAYHDIVVLNGAAALVVADKADSLSHGADMIRETLSLGGAAEQLKKMVAVSQQLKANA